MGVHHRPERGLLHTKSKIVECLVMRVLLIAVLCSIHNFAALLNYRRWGRLLMFRWWPLLENS